MVYHATSLECATQAHGATQNKNCNATANAQSRKGKESERKGVASRNAIFTVLPCGSTLINPTLESYAMGSQKIARILRHDLRSS